MSLLGFDGFSIYRSLGEIAEQSWVITSNPFGNLQLIDAGGQHGF